MRKAYTVTIGIPVYNEEKNILLLLDQLKKQSTNHSWILKEVLIYCDGSTDKTPDLVNSYNWPKIKMIYSPQRRGKVYRLGQIFSQFSSDLLVLLDADITLANKNTLNYLIQPFIEDNSVKLVGAYTQPHKPVNFFQRAVYSSFLTFDTYRRAIRKGNNIFNCTGACLALDRKLAKKIQFPYTYINEDDFIYLACIKNTYTFLFTPKAVAYYKLPSTFKDYFKTRMRSNHQRVRLDFRKYFGSLVMKETKVPKYLYVMSALKVLSMYPVEFIFISLTNLWIAFFAPFFIQNYKLSWYSAESTK